MTIMEEARCTYAECTNTEADIYPVTLLCSCARARVCVHAIKGRIKLDALKDAKGTML